MHKTLVSHFFNEEYLLPWWCEHHKKIFNHGILIDYQSTDNSVAIIKEICPTWTIIPSRFDHFGAEELDIQVSDVESLIQGWRVTLTTTEFLVGNNYDMSDYPQNTNLIIPCTAFFDWNPLGSLDKKVNLWDQINTVIDHKSPKRMRPPRSMHNYHMKYPTTGRHFPYEEANCTSLKILYFGHCISSPEMLKRRLQIQHRIPDSDKIKHYGHTHYAYLLRKYVYTSQRTLTENILKEYFDSMVPFFTSYK